MTIYEIKKRTLTSSPCYFDRKTMKFFGQTLKSFSVRKYDSNTYIISAPMYDNDHNFMGNSERLFNIETDNLEFLPK